MELIIWLMCNSIMRRLRLITCIISNSSSSRSLGRLRIWTICFWRILRSSSSMIMINCSNNISRVILGECRMVIKKVGVRRMGRKIVVWLKEVIIVIIRIILWSIFRMMCLISVCRRYCFVRIVYSLRLSIAILLLVRKVKIY